MNHDDSISILTSALEREQFPIGEWYHYDGKPHPLVGELPFYALVPKDPIAQLRYRRYVRQRCAKDREFRAAIDHACKSDILFHFNTLFWIFEPRPVGRRLPFNTWPDQDSYIALMWHWLGRRDLGGEKSRGIGWSYIAVSIAYHDWTALSESKIGLVSRKKDAVDKAEDSDALMWKLDFIHKHMPYWRRFQENGDEVLNRAICRFANAANGSTIFGYEATGNVQTGGRKRWMLLDEFAKFRQSGQEALNSTQHVTNSRLVISTYFRGITTRFFFMMRKEESSMLKFKAHWSKNPERAKGLYTFENGNLVILDKTYQFPHGYNFVDVERTPGAIGKKLRSPWYDAECNRPGATNESIAEELDIDPQNASTKLFAPIAIERAERTAIPALHVGELDFDANEIGHSKFKPVWIPREDGSMRIWAPLTAEGKVGLPGPFDMAADIAGGSGSSVASNSVIQVIDHNSGEQVLEFASNSVDPTNLAQLAYVLACWLADDRGQDQVQVNYEDNYGGLAFLKEMVRLGWGYFYMRESQLKKSAQRSTIPGWRNRDAGLAILKELQRALIQGATTIRSKELAEELMQWEAGPDGKPYHAGHAFEVGNTKGLAHGDRVMAYAICWETRQNRATETPINRRRPVPYGSIAWRVMEAAKNRPEMSEIDEWWDEVDRQSQSDVDDGLMKMIQDGLYDREYEPV